MLEENAKLCDIAMGIPSKTARLACVVTDFPLVHPIKFYHCVKGGNEEVEEIGKFVCEATTEDLKASIEQNNQAVPSSAMERWCSNFGFAYPCEELVKQYDDCVTKHGDTWGSTIPSYPCPY